MLRIVGFDADDTLWHDAREFASAECELMEMVSHWTDSVEFEREVRLATERNLETYGYGVKGFVLSAIEVLAGSPSSQLPSTLIRDVLALGRRLLTGGTVVLDDVADAISSLRGKTHLVLITKGDLWHQERKLESSGLATFFDQIEIVNRKNVATYTRIFGPQDADSPTAAMIGNSMRSDILPALAAGAWGVHVPHQLTWEHEEADVPDGHPHFRAFGTLKGAIDWLQNLTGSTC